MLVRWHEWYIIMQLIVMLYVCCDFKNALELSSNCILRTISIWFLCTLTQTKCNEAASWEKGTGVEFDTCDLVPQSSISESSLFLSTFSINLTHLKYCTCSYQCFSVRIVENPSQSNKKIYIYFSLYTQRQKIYTRFKKGKKYCIKLQLRKAVCR